MRCDDCPNAGPWAGGRGPRPCRLLFVGMCPGANELEEGVAFVGGSGKLLAAACAGARFSWAEAGALNVCNCSPLAPNGKDLTSAQILACRSRFEAELASSGAEVIVPLGGEALLSVCGFGGHRNGISAWRGYLVAPSERTSVRVGRTTLAPPALPSATRHIVPTYHPSYVMHTALRPYRWFARDIARAVRALRGELRVWRAPTENTPLPDSPPTLVALDIETVGYTAVIERLGVAWVALPASGGGTDGNARP